MNNIWDMTMMSLLLSPNDTGAGLKDLNVVAMLHYFWEQKRVKHVKGSSGQSESLLLYESAPSPGPPNICYVTLPGGSCFGNYQVCETQAEARRDAARVALMNSMVNELPSRCITPQFITHSLQEAASASHVSIEDTFDPSTSIGAYSLLLRTYTGRTMLEFQEMMTVFQLLHWNGTLKALRKRQCSRQSVIDYYLRRGLDACLRSSMALDWLEREQQSPGQLGAELQAAQRELGMARSHGNELRFYKEKTEILSLALSRTDTRRRPPGPESPSPALGHTNTPQPPESPSLPQSHTHDLDQYDPSHQWHCQDSLTQPTAPSSP